MKTTKELKRAVFAIICLTLFVTVYEPRSMHAKSENAQTHKAVTRYTAEEGAALLEQLKAEKTDFLSSSVESIITLGFTIRHPKFVKNWR